jgi:hypothetical protein
MKYFFSLIIILFTNVVNAQTGSVKGSLIDNISGEVMPYCNVVLFSRTENVIGGSISDEKGVFSFDKLKYGKYYLSYQSLTHLEASSDTFLLSIESPSVDVGKVKLKSQEVITEELEITYEKAVVKIEPAKKTFDAKATGVDAGGTATDLLNNLPSVDVDQDGNVSLRGNSNLRILINGKPAGVNKEDIALILAQLPANSIESVEVITVPSAKYDPEGVGGIINIILKKEQKKGFNGSANISYAWNDKVNASISSNYRAKIWGVNASYSFRNGNYWSNSLSDAITIVDDSTTWFDRDSRNVRKNPAHLGKIAFNYSHKKNTSITLESSVNHMDQVSSKTSIYAWDYNNESGDTTGRLSETTGSRTSGYGQFGISSKIKKVKLNAFSRYQLGDAPRISVFTENYSLERQIRDFKNDQWVSQVDLEIPFFSNEKDSVKRSLQMETGLKMNFRNFTEDFQYFEFSPSLNEFQEDLEISNQLDYGDQVFAGYSLLNFSKGKVAGSIGLRAEYTDITSKVSGTIFEKQMFNLFPSISFVKNYSDLKSLSFSYSKRIKRPTGRQLNPIASLSNRFSAHVGNAELIPERSHLAELSFTNISSKVTFSGTAFYQYRDDRMGRLSFTDSIGFTTIKWINFNFHQTAGLEFFFNLKLKKWLKINTSATFYRTWVDGENFRDGYIANYNGYDLKANFKFLVSKKTSFTLTGDYNSKRVAVVGVVLPRYGADVSMKHKFLKNKAYLTVRYTDIFLTRGFWIDVDTDNWVRKISHKYESQILWVGLGYSIGSKSRGKNQKKPPKSRGGDAM